MNNLPGLQHGREQCLLFQQSVMASGREEGLLRLSPNIHRILSNAMLCRFCEDGHSCSEGCAHTHVQRQNFMALPLTLQLLHSFCPVFHFAPCPGGGDIALLNFYVHINGQRKCVSNVYADNK